MPSERYPNFDLARLLLASQVFIDHASFIAGHGPLFRSFIEPVPGFLAVSGFLVLKSLERSTSVSEFFAKRVLRVAPALLVSLLLAGLLFGPAFALNSTLVWATGGLFHLDGPANGPLWSLLWEEIAYGSLVALWLLGAYKRPVWVLLMIAGAVAINWWQWDLTPHNKTILLLPVAFLVGNLMYLCRETLLRCDPFTPYVALFAVLQFRFSPDADMFGASALTVAQSFAVIWVSMAGKPLVQVKFPDISYGLYIYHWPIAAFLFESGLATSLPGLLIASTAVLVPFTLASWFLVEKPALRLKRRLSTAAQMAPAT